MSPDLNQFLSNTSRANSLINSNSSRSNSRIARKAYEQAVNASIFGVRQEEESELDNTRSTREIFDIDITSGRVNIARVTNPANPVDVVVQSYQSPVSGNNRRYSVGGGGVGSPAGTGGPTSTIGGQRNRIIAQFDRNGDGRVDDNETAYHLLRTRQFGSTRGISDLMSVNANAQKMQQLIAYADISGDGIFQDQEVIRGILAARKGDIQVDQNIMNLVMADNTKLQFIKDAIAAIDDEANGRISNLEVLDTLLASRQGLVNLQDPVIRTILSTNVKFPQLEGLLNSYDPNFNGIVSDKDTFRVLMALRQGNFTGELARLALHVGSNQNARSIERSIDLFDTNPDGTLSPSEFVNGVLAVRKGVINGAEHQPFLQALSQFPDLADLMRAVEGIDNDGNGVISDIEVVQSAFNSVRADLLFTQAARDAVLATNARTQEIMALFSRVNANGDANISDEEVFKGITDLKKGLINRNSMDVLGIIISQNPQSQGIIDAIQAFDIDNNGVISGEEALKGRIAHRRGQHGNLAVANVDMVLNSSPDDAKVDAILAYLDPDVNGLVGDIELFNKTLSFERGSSPIDKASHRDLLLKAVVAFDEDSNVRNALLGFDQGADGVVDDRDFANGFVKRERGELNISQELFEHIKTLNANSQIIMSAFEVLDGNADNQINAQEFVNNFNRAVAVNGQADPVRMAVVSRVIDILYPPAANLKQFSEALDSNSDKRLSDQELINGLLAVKQGLISNPGPDIVSAVVATNPNATKIISLITSIDADNNGTISNTELADNLLKVRKGEFASEDLGFVQAILDTNPNFDAIQNLVDVFDRNRDGNVSDLEMFDGLIQIKSGAYQGMIDPAVVNLIKSKNPNSAGLETLLTSFDPNGDGKVNSTELISGFLRVVSGQAQEPPAEFVNRIVDQNGQVYGASRIAEAKNFVLAVDANRNGQIADNEIIDMLLAQRNPNDSIHYNQALVDGALANNPNSQNIIALMNSIDVNNNGVFTDDEIIRAMFAFKKGDFANYNQAWVNQIFASNPNITELQALYDSVDTNNNGNVSDVEVVGAILKYKDAVLIPQFRDPSDLSAARMALLEQMLSTNNNYDNILTQFNSLARSHGGDLHEMMNNLLDIRTGAVSNNQYDLLIAAMGPKLDQWQAQRAGVYSQKISNLLGEIGGDAAVVDTGVNSNEEQLADRIVAKRAAIVEFNGDIVEYEAQKAAINASLANPPMITITERDDKGNVSQRQVVDAVEVARLNTQLQATETQLQQARTALAAAQIQAAEAATSAYATLGINTQTKNLMQEVVDLARGAAADLQNNRSTYYSKVDDLLDNYAQLTQVLPPNKERLLSLLFFDELQPIIQSLPHT